MPWSWTVSPTVFGLGPGSLAPDIKEKEIPRELMTIKQVGYTLKMVLVRCWGTRRPISTALPATTWVVLVASCSSSSTSWWTTHWLHRAGTRILQLLVSQSPNLSIRCSNTRSNTSLFVMFGTCKAPPGQTRWQRSNWPFLMGMWIKVAAHRYHGYVDQCGRLPLHPLTCKIGMSWEVNGY
jgi:hypothetical protein